MGRRKFEWGAWGGLIWLEIGADDGHLLNAILNFWVA
jgi:hypothetical protein